MDIAKNGKRSLGIVTLLQTKEKGRNFGGFSTFRLFMEILNFVRRRIYSVENGRGFLRNKPSNCNHTVFLILHVQKSDCAVKLFQWGEGVDTIRKMKE